MLIHLFYSCKRDEQVSWDVDLSAPLAKTKISINNLVADSLLKVGSDHSLEFCYNDTLNSIDFGSLFKIPDTTIRTSLVSPFWTTVLPGQMLLLKSDNINLNLQDAAVSEIDVKKGKLIFTVISTLKQRTKLIYQISSATKDGSPLNIVTYINGGNSGGTVSGEFDISGYNLNLTGDGTKTNLISTTIIAFNDSSSQKESISPGDSLTIYATFKDLVPNYAKGFFGITSKTIGEKQVNLSLFKNIISGNINLNDVKLSLNITNYLGVDGRAILNSLVAENNRTKVNTALNSSVIGKYINITRASNPIKNANSIIPQTTTIDIEGAAAKAFIENLPDKISYNVDFFMNPLGNVSGGNDFVYYGKGLFINMSLTIPIQLASNNLTLSDTVAFNNMKNTINTINGGQLYLISENTFPLEASIEMKLLNSNNQCIETITFPNAIQASNIGTCHLCAIPKKSVLCISLTEQRLLNLKNTKRIVFNASFTTKPDGEMVKIYDDSYLDLKLSTNASIRVNK